MSSKLLFPFAAVLALAVFRSPAAEDVRIVSWNVKDLLTTQHVVIRNADPARFGSVLAPDILIIQEFTSCEVAQRIKGAMNLSGFRVACSDFVQSDSASRSSFEVGIVSRFPMNEVVEFDPSLDNGSPFEPEEEQLEPLEDVGIQGTGTSRGFLMARMDSVKLYIIALHLKSSRGDVGLSDASNAQKREFVVGQLAKEVNEARQEHPDYTILAAGDFNVGHSDKDKNGADLYIDCYSECAGKDGYDETHALLASGIVGGLRMKNLMASVLDSTFPSFPGSPIDNIYVVGADADKFDDGQKSENSFGSDHSPVFTTLRR